MNRRIDYGKIALILTIVILGIFAVDFVRRLYTDWQGAKGTLNVHTGSSQVESISEASSYDPLMPETTAPVNTTTTGNNGGTGTVTSAVLTPPENFSTLQVATAGTATGSLILVNEEHAYSDVPDLSSFVDFKYAHLRLVSTSMQINTITIRPLVAMFNDFYNASGFGDMMIYSTTQEPRSAQYGLGVPERPTGLSIDLSILNQAASTHTPYTSSAYPWIAQHAADYGYVVRYPAGKEEQTGHNAMEWHLRYVGEPHAQYMKENNLCLEEYLALLREHSWDKQHLAVTSNGINYEIYYVKASNDSLTEIPYLNGTEPLISGDNMNGFVVACAKTGMTDISTETEETQPAAALAE